MYSDNNLSFCHLQPTGATISQVTDEMFYNGLILMAPRGFSFNQNPMVLNFTNGVLDLEEGKFSNLYQRELFQNIQFPFGFDRDQKCPLWMGFLKSLKFDDETILRLQEWVGYCLLPKVIGTLQKSLFFIGEKLRIIDHGYMLFLGVTIRKKQAI